MFDRPYRHFDHYRRDGAAFALPHKFTEELQGPGPLHPSESRQLLRNTSGKGDLYGQYLEYLVTTGGKQDVVSDLMNLTGTQQNVVLKDYYLYSNNNVPASAADDEVKYYASFDGINSGDPNQLAVDAFSTGAAPAMFSDWNSKYKEMWANMSSSQQIALATQYYNQALSSNPMTHDQVEKILKTQGGKSGGGGGGGGGGGDVTTIEVALAVSVMALLVFTGYRFFSE